MKDVSARALPCSASSPCIQFALYNCWLPSHGQAPLQAICTHAKIATHSKHKCTASLQLCASGIYLKCAGLRTKSNFHVEFAGAWLESG